MKSHSPTTNVSGASPKTACTTRHITPPAAAPSFSHFSPKLRNPGNAPAASLYTHYGFRFNGEKDIHGEHVMVLECI